MCNNLVWSEVMVYCNLVQNLVCCILRQFQLKYILLLFSTLSDLKIWCIATRFPIMEHK